MSSRVDALTVRTGNALTCNQKATQERAVTTPAQHGSTTTESEGADLADLDALADELNKLGLPALRLTPPGKPPYIDTGLPGGMTPGERIQIQAGTFFWHSAQPIAPSDKPDEAAAIITRALHTHTPQP